MGLSRNECQVDESRKMTGSINFHSLLPAPTTRRSFTRMTNEMSRLRINPANVDCIN